MKENKFFIVLVEIKEFWLMRIPNYANKSFKKKMNTGREKSLTALKINDSGGFCR